MLRIINGDASGIMTNDRWYVTQKYDGVDELGFSLSRDDPAYPLIVEEAAVEDGEQRYLIKAIDEGTQSVNIKCELDLDALRAEVLLDYTNDSATIYQTVSGVLPAGWRVEDHAHIQSKRTVEGPGMTPLEVIQACSSPFGVTFRFDVVGRVVHIYNPSQNEPAGVYVTDELNLQEINFKGSSRGYITRLYARGKDGLTFSDINGGLPYVEDHTYSDKIISAFWQDERYEIAENLLADAKAKLKEAAVPARSYTCKVKDLAQIDPEKYAYLQFDLYAVITMLDTRRKTRVNHMAVEVKQWPNYPEDNEITLSTVAPKIQNTVKSIQNEMENPSSGFLQRQQAAILSATQLISGALGGHYIVTVDPATGQPNGWAIMDTDNTETCKNVWRMTAGGLGHSSNGWNGLYNNVALTMDGKLVLSDTTTGVLSADHVQITGMIVNPDYPGTFWDLSTGEASFTYLSGKMQYDRIKLWMGEGAGGEEGLILTTGNKTRLAIMPTWGTPEEPITPSSDHVDIFGPDQYTHIVLGHKDSSEGLLEIGVGGSDASGYRGTFAASITPGEIWMLCEDSQGNSNEIAVTGSGISTEKDITAAGISIQALERRVAALEGK